MHGKRFLFFVEAGHAGKRQLTVACVQLVVIVVPAKDVEVAVVSALHVAVVSALHVAVVPATHVAVDARMYCRQFNVRDTEEE